MDEIDSIKQAIAALEAQRSVLGEAVVETALAPLYAKLAQLQPQPAAEQRKLVTVLFADLVGFTAMSEHMDPEDIREIVNAYFTRWTSCIEKAGGVVEKFIGDAVMAVFGLSHSQEDDPERAIQAALEMRQALAELNQNMEQTWATQLAMRTGIHTGTVMVSFLGERKGQDFVVVGDTVNIASRLQSIAPSGGILISQDTFRHVRGNFEVQMLDPVRLKGKEEPILAYQVLRAKRRTFHGPTRGVEGIETRLIGRDSELAILKEALLAAIEARKTQILTVVGEAGVGKSRLLAEFDHWVELQPQQQPQAKPTIRYFKGRASPAMQNLPYSLLRDLFSYSFQIFESDPPAVVQEKIEIGIGEFDYRGRGSAPSSPDPGATAGSLNPETQMRAHFIGQLLGFRFENSPYLRDALSNPRTFWDRALSYLVDYSKALLASGPVAVLLEDIHWADDASLEILEQIWQRLADEPLLVVCTSRPTLFENHPNWGKADPSGKLVFKFVHLASLTEYNSQHLVDEILQKAADIPESLRDLIVTKAEGNPFFIEELIKMLIEQKVILNDGVPWRVELSHLAGIQIPSTLVEVLQSRLDGLSPEERVLLQRASVLGRVFWDDAIRYMEQGQENQAQISAHMTEIMGNLIAKEMVFPHPISSFEDTYEYYFIHALLRDVTYDHVLKRLRRIYHGYAAAWLETITEQSHRYGEYAALIADHYELAGNREAARTWYLHAGNQAADTYANSEAVRCLTHCLMLWPEENDAGRYAVLLKRARLYDALANRPAQKQDLESLQILAEKLDKQARAADQPRQSHRAQVFLQWCLYYDSTGDLSASTEAVQQAIEFAQADGDQNSEAEGGLYLGVSLWRQSNFQTAKDTLQKALALARLTQSTNLEADCLRHLGIVLQYLGDFPVARAYYEEALRIYRETGGEAGESMTLNSLGILLLDQALYREALASYEQSLALKRKIGQRRGEHITLLNLGTLAIRLGNYLEALGYLEKVRQFAVESGQPEEEADALIGLGSAYLHMGEFPKAQKCLERAYHMAVEIDNQASKYDALQYLAMLDRYLDNSEAAASKSLDALTMSQDLDMPIYQANSLMNAAHALLELDRMSEAEMNYRSALEITQQYSDRRQILEIQAGLAMAVLWQGRLAQASRIVEEILTSLGIQNQDKKEIPLRIEYALLEGLDEPFQVLLTCYRVLAAAQDRRSGPLLNAAHALLQEQASRLPAGEQQANFLEMIPAHRQLHRLYHQLPGDRNGDLI